MNGLDPKISVLRLTGNSLGIEDLQSISTDINVHVEVSAEAISRVAASEKFLNSKITSQPIYGVNTGFGPMVSHIIGNSQLTELQYNLIRSHSAGSGAAIKSEFVLAAMVVRLNTLAKGYSGVSPELIQQLEFFINSRIIPFIPEHGAVGTSGDLVQLAHIALALIGEGTVFFDGKQQQTSVVLKQLNRKPHELKPKEGLSLINGTSVMSGIAALVVYDAGMILSQSIQSSVYALESINGLTDALAAELHNLRPHEGQIKVAAMMRSLAASSELLRSRSDVEKKVAVSDKSYVTEEELQNIYSFRCVPQILGPIVDIYRAVRKVVTIEINAVTDNPIVDEGNDAFLHGGNFHGDYIASSIDQLKIGLTKLTILTERRINFFLNRNVNKTFPPFLNLGEPGLTLGLQGLQFVATSTTAMNQSLAFPHSLHSIPTNADNQDVVSMGTDAALIAAKVVDNLYTVLAIELITIAQATECKGGPEKLSTSSKAIYNAVRAVSESVIQDRSLNEDLSRLISYMKYRDADPCYEEI